MDRLTGWHWHKLYCIILTLQEYGLDLYFWQVWNDTRLAQGQEKFLSLSGNDIKKVWTPDTYFMNAKKTEIKDVSSLLIVLDKLSTSEVQNSLTKKYSC